MKSLPFFLLIIGIAAVTGCTKSDSSSDNGGGGSGGGGDVPARGCGVVYKGVLEESVPSDAGKKGRIKSVTSSNTVIFSFSEGDILVKLFGLEKAEADFEDFAKAVIAEKGAGEVTFYQATDICTVSIDSGQGTTGAIINSQGKNLSEELIRSGFSGQIDSYGSCGEDLVSSCYNTIKDVDAPHYAGVITNLLWKPEGDGEVSKGKLVLAVNACPVDITANGEHLTTAAPECSYGRYNSFGRGPKSGCSYGNNVRVEVKDLDTEAPYLFPDGKTSYTVANGCQRTEFYEY